jgi:phosphoribosylaminoimidazolecarboxamide formyltransferase / IMP cyclohydrolase
MNPHQKPARAFRVDGGLPFDVVNGEPGFINLVDALNAWQLVSELTQATGLPAAASFKHASPAGAAVATPLSAVLAESYFVDRDGLSALAIAYARARGADRLSSFGDIAALSMVVDEATANLLAREASDGVVAPGYSDEARKILASKRDGHYLMLEIDPAYKPARLEHRDVYGVTLEQPRNAAVINDQLLRVVVTREKRIPTAAVRDLLVALITVKYTQSNSVALARDGQAIGIGAGQQSRIDCTRLACEKAERWWLRQHPRTRELRHPKSRSRPERDNAIDEFVRSGLSDRERQEWLAGLADVSLASDGFIPFRDNIDRAYKSGARYVAQPGGSRRDADVIAACDEHEMIMAVTGLRLFHH